MTQINDLYDRMIGAMGVDTIAAIIHEQIQPSRPAEDPGERKQ